MAPKFLNLWGLKESNNNEAYDKGIISELTSNEAISEIIGSSDIWSDRVLVHSLLLPADESLFNLYTVPHHEKLPAPFLLIGLRPLVAVRLRQPEIRRTL